MLCFILFLYRKKKLHKITYCKWNSPIRPTHRHIRPGRNTARPSIGTGRFCTGTDIRQGCVGMRRGPGSTAAVTAAAAVPPSCCRRSRAYRHRTGLPTRPICRCTWPRRCTIRIRADTVHHRIETYMPDILQNPTLRWILNIKYHNNKYFLYTI